MPHRFLARLAASAAVLSLPSVASALLIDDFSAAQSLQASVSGGTEVTSSVAGAGILGGERDLYLLLTTGSSATIDVSSGSASYAEVDASDSQLYVSWDGADNSAVIDQIGLGGIDLTAGGSQNALSVQILLNNQPAANLGFLAHTSASEYSIIYFSAPSGASTQTIPFADFVPLAGTGADFANIGALSFFSDPGVAGQSVQLGAIQTAATPEPGSGSLLLLGLLGLAGWRSEKR